MEIIVLAGGCFWCTEALFQNVKGVSSVMPGYAGGTVMHPTYETVCQGTTGHAEVVKVTYDPSVISTHDVLELFLTTHDPTTLNRQGHDSGTQYRSAIFYTTAMQKQVAEQVIADLTRDKVYTDPIVTEIQPLDMFYEAEEYHHDYYKKNPEQAYCQAVIEPKLAKFRQKYSQYLKG